MTGPVFNGRANAEATVFCRQVEDNIAHEAVNRIREYLPTQYKYRGHSGGNPQDNPVPDDAGYYEASIHADSSSGNMVVTDDAVYGPWLEGVSSVNQAKRFPGYGTFRKISQEVDKEATTMAEAALPPHLAIMNGV